jgi:AcrR family transcriptional regulator
MAEKWTPERRRELTRTALMDAAAEVFASRGFHGASLEEIAETAGFTRGAIYKNFASKEELFLAVLDRRIEQQLAQFSDVIESDGADAAMDPARMAEVWRKIGGSDTWLPLDLEFRLYAMRNPEVRARLSEHERAFREAIARFIEEETTAMGITLAMSPSKVAAVVLPATLGFGTFAALDLDGDDPYATFLEMLMTAMVGPGDEESGG